MMCIWNKKIKLSVYAAVVSLWTLVWYNIPFLQFAAQNAECSTVRKAVLLASLVVVILSLHYMLIYLMVYGLRIVGRILLAIVNLLNAAATYFVVRFNVLMDSSMLGNVFNTRYSEASGFFCWQLWLAVVLIGILPTIYIIGRKVERGSGKQLGQHTGIALLIALVVAGCNLDRTLWFGKYDTELGGLIMPWSYIVNTGRLMAIQANENKEETLLPDATIRNNERETVVLIIGESARRANFQLYGYEKETNPQLIQITDLHALMARSNATYTTAGMKAMLEHKDCGTLYEILPNYLYRHGVDVEWRSSNWGETPLHIGDRYINRIDLAKQLGLNYNNYDEILYMGLKDLIENCPKDKQLIILHTSTSHGPEYQEQYPKAYSFFDEQDIIGAYDNSIRYTDACLANLIDTLRTIQNRKTAMIYMSDHGESLGENGMYMHGAPMAVAPKVQYEVPLLVWTSPQYRTLKPQKEEVDQHSIFHSVLNLLSMDSPIYDAEHDLFTK